MDAFQLQTLLKTLYNSGNENSVPEINSFGKYLTLWHVFRVYGFHFELHSSSNQCGGALICVVCIRVIFMVVPRFGDRNCCLTLEVMLPSFPGLLLALSG